jgi:HAD superfamily hydrolase (TIGR01549 family)
LYRGVAFDFADTLAELSPSRESLIVDLCRDHAKTVLSEQRVALAYRLLDSLNPYSSVTIRSATAKRAFYLQYNQKLLTLLGMSHLIGPEQVYDGFASKTPHWRLKQGVQSMLARLSQSNLSLALLSNFDTKLYDVLARLGIDHYFQQICVSQELGVEKPSPKFFEQMTSRLDVQPSECYYFGDSYTLDFLPGTLFGLSAYLLDEAQLYPHLSSRLSLITEAEIIMLGATG